MSSTRYSSDPDDFSPERHLASGLISGINIGLNTIGRVARARTEHERHCMVWLHNYARMMQLTADSLGTDLGLSLIEIREALTDPRCTHMQKFCEAVGALRTHFEASIPKLVRNRVYRAVENGIEEASDDKVFGLIIGPERIGKSEAMLDIFQRKYMHRGILFSCSESRDMRTFICDNAAPLGINVSRAKKNDSIRQQVIDIYTSGAIDTIFMDEIQRIWPSDLATQFPEKIEFMRTAWDKAELIRRVRRGRDGGGGLAIIGNATPQFADDLNTAIAENRRWKPGQFEGRMRRTYTPETLTETEVRNIARHTAPEFDEQSIERLTTVTLASPGLLGFLSNVVGKIRFKARKDNREISPDLVGEAAREMLQGTTTEKRAKEAARKAAAQQRSLPQ
jgi:hypothetical protein